MKRFNKTAVALATAGAMTLAIVPNANAEDLPEGAIGGAGNAVQPDGTEATVDDFFPPVPGATNGARTGQTGEGAGENSDLNSPAEAGNIGELNPDANEGADWADTSKPARNPEGLGASVDTNQPVGTPLILKKGDRVGTIVDGEFKVRYEVKADNEVVDVLPNEHVLDANKVDVSTIRGLQGVKSGIKPGELEDDTAAAIAAAVGLAALPVIAIVAGVKYIWDKKHQVYVPEEKAGKEPTAEDKAASDKLISENADELKRQAAAAEKNGEEVVQVGDFAAADRGVGAATGNNTIAKGLVGLLIASIMGAAVFAFGRRRLV